MFKTAGLILATAVALSLAPNTARAATTRESTAPPRAGISDLGRLPATQRVDLALVLRYRDATRLEQLVEQQGDPESPLYHRFLSSEQFDASFAPSPSEYVGTIALLERAGFRVT